MEKAVNKQYKIAFLGGEEISLGFKLSGVAESYNVLGSADAESIVRRLMQRQDIGLIVLTSGILKSIKDRKLLNAIDSSILPMVIEIPGYGEEQIPDTLRRLIIRAIGIDISKNLGG